MALQFLYLKNSTASTGERQRRAFYTSLSLEGISQMPEQDLGARKMQHGHEVLDLVCPARDEPPRVVKPGKQAFDFPAAARAAQRAAILRAAAPTPVRGDHLDSVGSHEGRIERITVVAPVADQARREVGEEAGLEGGGDEVRLI